MDGPAAAWNHGAMKTLAFLAAAAMLADPLDTAMNAAGGALCYTRSYDAAWLKANPGQEVRAVRLALNERDDSGGPHLRLHIVAKGKPAWVFGECQWFEGDLNQSAQGDVLDPSFKERSGLGCMVYTDTTGESAEEGGWFQAAWRQDGDELQLHFDQSMAAWREPTFDRRAPDSFEFAPKDSILRLRQAKEAECADLIAMFPAKS